MRHLRFCGSVLSQACYLGFYVPAKNIFPLVSTQFLTVSAQHLPLDVANCWWAPSRSSLLSLLRRYSSWFMLSTGPSDCGMYVIRLPSCLVSRQLQPYLLLSRGNVPADEALLINYVGRSRHCPFLVVECVCRPRISEFYHCNQVAIAFTKPSI